jgi:hypothetical protein
MRQGDAYPGVYTVDLTDPDGTKTAGYSLSDVFPTTTTASGSNPFFDDPTTQPLMNQWTARMAQLNRPSPSYSDLEASVRRSTAPNPLVSSIIATLASRMNARMPVNNYGGRYEAETARRIDELHKDPFSAADEAALKARFYDSTARSRTQAQKAVLEQMGALGHSPTDGAVVQALEDVARNYDVQQAGQQQALLEYVMNETQNRKDKAVTLAQALANLGLNEQQLAAQWANSQAQWGGAAAGLALDQQRMGLSGAEMLASLRRQAYIDDLNRGGQALQVSALPSDLANQRLMQFYSLLSGMTPNSQNMMSTLGSMAGLNMGAQQQDNQNTAAMMQLLGQLAAAYAGSRK